jgi:hypothetical protein
MKHARYDLEKNLSPPSLDNYSVTALLAVGTRSNPPKRSCFPHINQCRQHVGPIPQCLSSTRREHKHFSSPSHHHCRPRASYPLSSPPMCPRPSASMLTLIPLHLSLLRPAARSEKTIKNKLFLATVAKNKPYFRYLFCQMSLKISKF